MRREAGPGVELLKVGAPAFADQRPYHLRLAEELGIAEAVRWLDEVREEDLPLFYNAADVFAFPSLSEGFGLPVLEALACGTPVVARRTSSLPELAEGAATLLDPGTPEQFAAAIAAMLGGTRPDAEALVRHAAAFTWERTIAGVRQVYAEVVSESAEAVR